MIFEGVQIDNIVFDLGGVILNIDYQLPVIAFNQLGLRDFQQEFSQASQKRIFDDYETGRISSDEFVQLILEKLPLGISKSDIIEAWNSILLDLPEERLFLLEKAAENHRIFLLSNTNDLHIKSFNNYLQHSYGIDGLETIFEKLYYSYQIGLRKPETAIFQYVLKDAALNPATTLFIDDSVQHVNAARNCGINAYLLEKTDLIDLLSDKL